MDDEETILAITKSMLENFGYMTITAASGPEAVAYFAEHRDKIKLVITDLDMPFMDGIAIVLRKITAETPIIISSGLEPEKYHDTSRRIKAAVILQKPFSVETLLTQIHVILTAKKEPGT